jgi:asparagine synthase (glutamine-hydrolysing)
MHRINSLLVHRGPDQQGIWESATVSIGAVRLKIIDLSGGNQPLTTSDAQTVIAFNGEIYNHRELRSELEARGHRFESLCDTEVVLRAFVEWDVDCFARLRGMFAVAFWSEREQRLVLARDRMGIKPLYIHARGRELYFGSELKAILAHPEVGRALDLAGLANYLSLNWVPGSRTLVEGVEKLPPAHWLEWHHGKVRTHRYWTLELAPKRWTLPDAKQQLDTLLRDSVREHLISDVPLGVWASGGLDSSTILHYASELVSAPLKTFSVSFRGRSFDESRYFREIARIYGTDHHEFDLSPEVDLCEVIEELPYYSDEPSADAGALPVWFLSRLSRRHVTVALSGEGADELFGGYHTYLADGYARRLRLAPAWMRRAVLRLVDRLPVSDEKIGFEYKLKRFLRGSLLPPREAHFYWNGTFDNEEKRRLLEPYAYRKTPDFAWTFPSTGFLNAFLGADQMGYLPDDILNKCDRMSMAHSLEVRPPFLDHRIVEFAASLPKHFKIRGSTLKFLLRELMRNKLPSTVTRRAKEGFDIPAHDWMRGPLRPLVEHTLSSGDLARTGLFSPGEVLRVIGDHMERRANYGYHLWGLLILLLWLKRWGIETRLPDTRQRIAEHAWVAS